MNSRDERKSMDAPRAGTLGPRRVRIGCRFAPRAAVALGAIALGWTAPALGCDINPAPAEFYCSPGASGTSPPAELRLTDVDLQRSRRPPPGNGNCREVGRLNLTFELGDGRPWPSDVGLRLLVSEGSPPSAFEIPDHPLVTDGGTVRFAGGDDPREAIGFTLQAIAVDAHCNESEPVEVRVSHPGRKSALGCAVSGVAQGAPTCALALSVLALAVAGVTLRKGRRVPSGGASNR